MFSPDIVKMGLYQSSVFSFCYFPIYISPQCCFPWHVFFIKKMVHYHIVVFPLFLPSLHPSSWHASSEVTSVSCSFVIISFCSFLQPQLCLLSCTQSPNINLLPLNLCITNFYIFACCFKFLHATDCYIFVSVYFRLCIPLITTFLLVYIFGFACHWLLHLLCCSKYVVGKRPGWNLGVMGMYQETRVIMWFGIRITWVHISRLLMLHWDND